MRRPMQWGVVVGVMAMSVAMAIPVRAQGEAGRRPAPGTVAAVAFEGTTWVLAELGGKPVLPGREGKAPYITFQLEEAGYRVGGNTGINRFSAPYAKKETTLKIGPGVTTKMAGPPDLMKQEATFVQTLAAVRAFRIQGNRLLLLNEKGVTLASFLSGGASPGTTDGGSMPARPAQKLEGTGWYVTMVEGAALPGGKRRPFIQFEAGKNRAYGFCGVNSFNGRYQVNGAQISINLMATTRMAGSPDAMRFESAFLAALGKARTFAMSAGGLELKDGAGKTLARFSAANAPR